MKVRPSVTSFLLRYFIFTYFFLFSLFSIWLKSEMSFVWYVSLWILITMLPALILSFKRVKIGWFLWIGILDLLAFSPQFKFVYDKLSSFSSNQIYQETLKWLQNSSEIKIYMMVSITGMIVAQLYRLTFSYEISKENGIELKSGLFSKKDNIIFPKEITEVSVYRGFLQRIFGIGTIVPITSSGMGMGTNGVFGGGMVEKGGVGGFVGTEKKLNVPVFSDPSLVIYGVKDPQKVKDAIFNLKKGIQ